MPKGNPTPDVARLHAQGKAAVTYVEQLVDHAIHCWIDGRKYQPIPVEHPILIPKKEAMRRTGRSYPTLWNLEKKGEFPARVKVPSDRAPEAADAAD